MYVLSERRGIAAAVPVALTEEITVQFGTVPRKTSCRPLLGTTNTTISVGFIVIEQLDSKPEGPRLGRAARTDFQV